MRMPRPRWIASPTRWVFQMRDRRRTVYPPGSPRAKLWQALRIMRTCGMAELCATCDLKPGTARAYIEPLVRAGFVRSSRSGPCGLASYALARDTGPHAPRVWMTKRAVYDINTRTTYEFGETE